MRKSFGEPRSVGSRGRHLICENTLAARFLQRVALHVEILVGSGDVGVADEHVLAFLKVVKSGD
jgi:hypothetical protein